MSIDAQHKGAALSSPTLVYDGECGFCRGRAARWRTQAGLTVEFMPASEIISRFPEYAGLPFHSSAFLIEPSGAISRGAGAILRMQALAGRRRWPLFLYENLPGFRVVAERVYTLIARHRRHLPV